MAASLADVGIRFWFDLACVWTDIRGLFPSMSRHRPHIVLDSRDKWPVTNDCHEVKMMAQISNTLTDIMAYAHDPIPQTTMGCCNLPVP